jgi:hypothetical protein
MTIELVRDDHAFMKEGIEDAQVLLNGHEGDALAVASVYIHRTGEVGYHYTVMEKAAKLALIGGLDVMKNKLVDDMSE